MWKEAVMAKCDALQQSLPEKAENHNNVNNDG